MWGVTPSTVKSTPQNWPGGRVFFSWLSLAYSRGPTLSSAASKPDPAHSNIEKSGCRGIRVSVLRTIGSGDRSLGRAHCRSKVILRNKIAPVAGRSFFDRVVCFWVAVRPLTRRFEVFFHGSFAVCLSNKCIGTSYTPIRSVVVVWMVVVHSL